MIDFSIFVCYTFSVTDKDADKDGKLCKNT